MVFETVGLSWGYVFVIVIAGASLVIGYYKKKGLITFQSPIKKDKKEGVESES